MNVHAPFTAARAYSRNATGIRAMARDIMAANHKCYGLRGMLACTGPMQSYPHEPIFNLLFCHFAARSSHHRWRQRIKLIEPHLDAIAATKPGSEAALYPLSAMESPDLFYNIIELCLDANQPQLADKFICTARGLFPEDRTLRRYEAELERHESRITALEPQTLVERRDHELAQNRFLYHAHNSRQYFKKQP